VVELSHSILSMNSNEKLEFIERVEDGLRFNKMGSLNLRIVGLVNKVTI
jgi:hypothetical protein